ncbi:MAG TPA: hypothetical protein VMQ93_08750 [Novosphingobium sp.]|nr:hypothetical protein [Novosphingobium sp.]
MIEAFFIRFAARLVPERFQRIVAWILAGLALLLAILVLAAAIWGASKLWIARHDAAVVERHEEKREAAAADATVKSAEERAVDALANQMDRSERDQAIATAAASEASKPPEARATVPPTTLARRCAQFRQSCSVEQLAKMPTYQKVCS